MERQEHLEGLRGIACVQVMLLHGIGAFLPSVNDLRAVAWLWDGDLAVFVFFVLSGYVLTPAFTRGIAAPGKLLLGRLVRFLLPALMACGFGWAMAVTYAGAPGQAGAVLGSSWLMQNVPSAFGVTALMRDAGLNVLFLGYRGLSLLDGVAPGVPWDDGAGFNPPLWTLSVELQGSVLVLGLCMLRTRWIWILGVLASLILFGRTPFLAFIAGHVMARHRLDSRLCAAGLAAAALVVLGDPDAVAALPDALLWRCVGAIALFALVQSVPGLQRMLARPTLRRLGTLSFPLYLLHWPLLFGPGAAIAVILAPLGPVFAGSVAMATGLLLAFMGAPVFLKIDRLALAWSRRVRAPVGPAVPA